MDKRFFEAQLRTAEIQTLLADMCKKCLNFCSPKLCFKKSFIHKLLIYNYAAKIVNNYHKRKLL